MKVIIAGGTGRLGRLLTQAFLDDGQTVIVLTREISPPDAPRVGAEYVHWDGRQPGPWMERVDGGDLVVNLAGRSVDCRYNEQNLAEMVRSRLDSTRAIGQAIARAKRPPRLWLQASTATIYAHRFDAPNDEVTGLLGGNEPGVPALWKRSVDLALDWERELFAAATPETRRVALRTAMVMGPEKGGVFDAFAGLCRVGFGHHGPGTQFVSWIHEADFLGAIRFLVAREDLDGAVNLAAPEPLPNREFIRAIREALGGRIAIPVPSFLLEVGALLRGTETELLLKSRRVVPRRLLDAGFVFRFPNWPSAARDLAARWC